MTRDRRLESPRRHLIWTLAVTALLTVAAGATPSPAVAQKVRFEITPYYGHSFLGSFEIDDYEFGRLDLEIDDGTVDGVVIGFPLRRNLHLELFVNEQETGFGLDEGPFLGAAYLGGMDVDYYQAGVSWTGSLGQVRPFASLTAGVTRLAPSSDFLPESESHFSIGLGGGVKVFFTDHVGLRLDARLLVTDTSDEDGCCYDCCYGAERDDLVQGLVSAGLVFAF